MGSIRVGLGLLLGLCLGSLALAQQPPNTNIRGMVTAFDGKTVVVKARDGTTLEVLLPETLAVSGTKAFTLADLKPGMTLGVTTVKRADGQLVAIDVRPIPATARIGLSPFDLQPDSTMTNAILEAQVVSMSGAELTLDINDGTLKVLVPPGTPMSQSIPGNRADVKPGETVFIAARPGPDGKLTAARIQVSTNGVKPTQ
jgi:hypothetical protein